MKHAWITLQLNCCFVAALLSKLFRLPTLPNSAILLKLLDPYFSFCFCPCWSYVVTLSTHYVLPYLYSSLWLECIHRCYSWSCIFCFGVPLPHSRFFDACTFAFCCCRNVLPLMKNWGRLVHRCAFFFLRMDMEVEIHRDNIRTWRGLAVLCDQLRDNSRK